MVPYTSVNITHRDLGEVLKSVLALEMGLKHRGVTKKVNKPIVLFGAGNLGRLAADFFAYVGEPISTVVVDQTVLEPNADPFWKERGIQVLSLQEVPEDLKRDSLVLVCIVTSPVIPIMERLHREGWEDVAPFYDVSQSFAERGVHPLNNGWFLNELEIRDKQNTRIVFKTWDDEMSRAHYLQFLAWRRCRVELFSEEFPVLGNNRFFIPEVVIKFGEQEIFVDCGAHTGSVIPTFLRVVGGKYRHIYAIEPDPQNLIKLKREIEAKENLTLVEVALTQAEAEGKQRFFGGFDYASKLDSAGNIWVDTNRLDNLHITPTFVKMHLEGGELAALYGAISTISIHRPILAITVYHDDQGVWQTPMFLMGRLVGYRFLFRVHSYAGTGAVIYAIPAER